MVAQLRVCCTPTNRNRPRSSTFFFYVFLNGCFPCMSPVGQRREREDGHGRRKDTQRIQIEPMGNPAPSFPPSSSKKLTEPAAR